MKKILLFLAAGAWLFGACTNDDEPVIQDEQPYLSIEGTSGTTLWSKSATFSIDVRSSSEVIATPSDGQWIEAKLISSADHVYNYEISVKENATDAGREGKIVFTQSSGTLSATFTIMQNKPSENEQFLSIEGAANTTLSSEPATFSIDVMSSSEVIATPSDAQWMEATFKSMSDQRYHYEISIKENTTCAAREGHIVFTQSSGTLSAAFSIVQQKAPETIGLYVLSEGSMMAGNGQLAYFDFNRDNNKFVKNTAKTFKSFGEIPNDMLVYGSKAYVAITGEAAGGIVKVINVKTGETIREIALTHAGKATQPRRLAAHAGKVYITSYTASVARIDTASYATNTLGLSGTFPEGLCVYNNLLYICDSGQGEDNKISVVDIDSFTEKETITVPYNPVNIVVAKNGELYFNTASVWTGAAAGAPANVHSFNPATKQVTKTFDVPAESIAAGKDYIYGAATTSWTTFDGLLKKISISDKSVSDFTTASNKSKLLFAYKVFVNPLTGEVFLTQQMGQDINRFNEDGLLIETLKAGQQNGAAVVFVNE